MNCNPWPLTCRPFAAHPNRAPFRGVLTLVDTPSRRGALGRARTSRPAHPRRRRTGAALAARHGARLHALRSTATTPAARWESSPKPISWTAGWSAAAGAHRVAQGFSPANKARQHDPALAAEGPRTVRAAISSGAKALLSVAAGTAGLPRLRSGQVPPSSTRLARISACTRRRGHWPLTTDHSRASTIEIAGYLYARDFPDVMRELRGQSFAGQGAGAPARARHVLRDHRRAHCTTFAPPSGRSPSAPSPAPPSCAATRRRIAIRGSNCFRPLVVGRWPRPSAIDHRPRPSTRSLMDELNEQLTTAATRLAAAVEALENALSASTRSTRNSTPRWTALSPPLTTPSRSALSRCPGEPAAEAAELKSRVAELERTNAELKAQAAAPRARPFRRWFPRCWPRTAPTTRSTPPRSTRP